MEALKNITVLDLTRVMAGPWCTQILADYGADVIKVERPGTGDDSRGWGPPFLPVGPSEAPTSAYFLSANRGKKSIAVDFTTAEGRDTILKLVLRSDVFIENFIPGSLARYGLDFESLRAINPRLVYCSISGYGQSGPYAQRPGYDAVIQGVGGMMSVTGEKDSAPGGGPQKVGLPVVDLMTGQYATIGIMIALWERQSSGVGQKIDLALLDVQVSALAPLAASFFATGSVPARNGNEHATIAPSNVYECMDGSIQLTIGNDGQFQKFVTCLGVADMASDILFSKVKARSTNRKLLESLICPIIAGCRREQLVQELSEAGIPCGPINDFQAVFSDPQVIHSGMVVKFSENADQAFSVVRNPLNLSRTPAAYSSRPPALGEHTSIVLDKLDESQDQSR